MNFELSDEQRAFRDIARAFASEQLAPHAAEWDEQCQFPVATLREAAKLGFAGIYLREDFGGAGLSRLDAAIVFEELAAGCTSTAAYISIHNMVAWMIDAFGADEQRARWVPDLMTMERFASYCLTEPDSGSDAAALKTRAERQGEEYVLNGSKAFISGAGAADVYACMVRTGGEGPRGISCVVVERDAPGLSFGAQEKKLGWHSQPTAMVIFDDCRVPLAHRIGREGEGFKIAMQGLDGGRINIAACALGAARACYERARPTCWSGGSSAAAWPTSRRCSSGLPTWRPSSRRRGSWSIGRQTRSTGNAADATMACAMAKRFATDVAFKVCNDALQLHGGYGYIKEYAIERFLRDVRVHQILEGTNEIMRLIIARRLLDG